MAKTTIKKPPKTGPSRATTLILTLLVIMVALYAAVQIAGQLNTALPSFEECTVFGHYANGTKVTEKPQILFVRLDVKEVVEKAEAMFAERRAAAEAENGAQGSGAAGNDAQGAAQGGAAAENGSAAQTAESADGSVTDIEAKPEISYEDFAKMQFQVGEIIACEEVKKSKKLLCSQVKIGSQVKQIVSGIKAHYTAQEMVGKKVMVLVNLKPAKLAGVLSEGMLLCAEDADGNLALVVPEKDMPAGAEIC